MEGKHGKGDCPDDCFGCKIRTLQFDPYSMPSRLHPERAPRKPNNSYEKGIPTDSRGMPFLRPDGSAMGQVEVNANKRSIEELRRSNHNASQDSLAKPGGPAPQ